MCVYVCVHIGMYVHEECKMLSTVTCTQLHVHSYMYTVQGFAYPLHHQCDVAMPSI